MTSLFRYVCLAKSSSASTHKSCSLARPRLSAPARTLPLLPFLAASVNRLLLPSSSSKSTASRLR